MTRSWMALPGLLLLTSAGHVLAGPPSARAEPDGVVVEEVAEGFAAHQAGLRPGDILLRWERAATPPANPEPARGVIDSPFDLLELELEQAPRGELMVLVRRGDERFEVLFGPGEWKLRTRPQLRNPELDAYEDTTTLIAEGEIDRGLSLRNEMASALGKGGDHTRAGWLFLEVARAAGESREWEVAEGAFQEAQREAGTSGEALLLATTTDAEARFFSDRGDFERAAAGYRQALEIRQASSPASLGIAVSLDHLGGVAFAHRDVAAAGDFYRRSLALREKLAPGSLAVAESFHSLGKVAFYGGDLAAAEDYHRRSLAIWEGHGLQGDGVARGLNSLGVVAFDQGDLAAAESYYRRSLAIWEKLAPQSVGAAHSLNNLAGVAWYRGDPATAEDYCRRSLAIREKLAPQSVDVAVSLSNLGALAYSRGDLATAEDYFRRSLAITEKVAPQSLVGAMSLCNLGEVTLDRQDLVSSEDFLRRALAIYEELAPSGVDTAEALRLLGDAALARSDLDSAEAHYQRSLAIRRERAPGSALEAESCQRLATLHRRRSRPEEALAFYHCAVEALEAQRGKVGGSDEVRSGFGAKHANIYREAIDLLVEVGRTEAAFHLLERYRARELVALLAGRDLVFSSDIPEELESRRRSANQSYDRAFGRWMQLPDQAGAEERQKARGQLGEMRRRQDEIRAEIRAASPRLAALQDPQPLDLSATRAALDPGTLLLSYSIGEERSTLFAVGPRTGSAQRGGRETSLRAFPLAVGEESLRDEVERFREALHRGRLDRRPEKALLHARRLSELLLAPAAVQIAQAERLLILADGPLHSMPFAALVDPGAIEGRRFLVEAKPVHLAASATVFALIKQERREPRAIRLTAFGDPRYPATAPRGEEAAPQLHAALRSGFDLTPLPATRGEVESLRRLYPQASRVYLGAEATEGRAKAVGKETTHLHIASHGLLDDRFPLDSALVFSIPSRWQEGEDNGLLQAWEIFEQVRIDADLVTLSACDTGLGKVLGGEGLLGLTRAFQYAGARSVLASLWSVSDDSTGELMKRFYGYLKEGRSKAEALRSAQLDLFRSSEYSHPFHWAGFQLVGDWR